MRRRLIFGLLILGASSGLAFSQTMDLGVKALGYFQATFEEIPKNSLTSERSSFFLQQANIMLEKGFSNDLSAFVNISFSNTYSSENNWGDLDLEDAWLRYRSGNGFNIKAGLLVPTFNNLNEIKDKTPLLPYIIRPGVYEKSVSDLLRLADYVPQQAFLQVYGFLPLGDVKFDYALYVGNSDPAFMNGLGGNFVLRGADTTSHKLIGGRVGIRVAHLKFGVSSTSDKSNRNAIGLGTVQRYRLGCDLSCQLGALSLEAEFIDVLHALTATQKQTLAWESALTPLIGNSLAEFFSYAVVQYDCTDRTFVYVGQNYVVDKSSIYLSSGFNLYTAGAGYRISDEVVVKGQYLRLVLGDNPFVTLTENQYLIALSVMI